MKIIIGADEAGYKLKEELKAFLEQKGCAVIDLGVHNEEPVLYPDIAVAVAQAVKGAQDDRGILICGTGIGMAITANKVPGIRAAVCHDPYSAERARKSNDAQIMCLGARVIGTELAKLLADTWLRSEFAGGSSLSKVQRMIYYDNQYKQANHE